MYWYVSRRRRCVVLVLLSGFLATACSGDGRTAQRINVPPLRAYFHYSDAELASLPVQDPSPLLSVSSLARWHRLSLEIVRSHHLSAVAAARFYASMAVAQNDFAAVSKRVRGEPSGNIDLLSARMICLFFATECADVIQHISIDPFSDQLSVLIVRRLQEKLGSDDAQTPLTSPGDTRHWPNDGVIDLAAGQWQPWLIAVTGSYLPSSPPRDGSPEQLSQLQTVRTSLANLTDLQRSSIYYWSAAEQGESLAGLWLNIFDRFADQIHMPLEAQLTARYRLSVTIADALIVCWKAKYTYWGTDPSTVDAAIATIVAPSPVPSYPSTQATVSAAAAEVLEKFFPSDERRWLLLAENARDAQLWAGVSYPSDTETGFRLGQDLARVALAVP